MKLKHAIAMLCLSALLPGSAFAGCVQAFQSDKFVDSIGINTHLDYPNYTPWSTVEPILTNLGVRHIRWGFAPSYSQNQELVGLYAYGITANLCFDTLTSGTLDTSKIVSTLTSMDSLSYSGTSVLSGVESVEGPNEYDTYPDPAWLTDLTDYQQELYTDMAKDSNYDNIPALAPSMGVNTNLSKLPNMDTMVDMGNAHPYNGSGSPYTNENPENITVSTFLRYSQQDWPGLALEESENGYSTISGTQGISEAQQAIWLPRLLLENYRLGIRRTFLYELIDEDLPSSTGDYYHHFGLVELTGTSPSNTFQNKPSYAVIQNLITILKDPGGAFAPGYISYELSGSTTNVHELALEKRNGAYYVALWVATTGTAAVSQSVNVTFAEPISSGTLYAPVSSASGTSQTITNNGVTLTLSDQPVILAVTPTPLLSTGAAWTDYLNDFALTYSSTNWVVASATPANWWGASSVAQRTTDTTTNSIVYASPGIDGFTARFGFPNGVQYPGQVTWNLASYVTFYTSPDDTTWTVLPANAGAIDKTQSQLSISSSQWFEAMSPSGPLPYGTNFLKVAITTPTGVASTPGLFQMNLSQNGKLEGENMSESNSGGISVGDTPDAQASGGKYLVFYCTGTNQWGQCSAANIPPGTYEVYYRYALRGDAGQGQFAVDGTNTGSVQDEYGTAAHQYVEADMGSFTWSTTATHAFRVTVEGKDAASSSYTVNVDRVVLRATAPLSTSGTYTLTNVSNGKLLSISGTAPASNGDAIMIDQQNSTEAMQQWKFAPAAGGAYTLTNVYSGDLVTVSGTGLAPQTDGDPVYQWASGGGAGNNGAAAQKWSLLPVAPNAYILDAGSDGGKYITVSGGTNGALVDQWQSITINANTQQWTIQPVLIQPAQP